MGVQAQTYDLLCFEMGVQAQNYDLLCSEMGVQAQNTIVCYYLHKSRACPFNCSACRDSEGHGHTSIFSL